jgi:hypothetical protein
MRVTLFGLSGEHPPAPAVHAVLGVIGHHLAVGRRSPADTMTVLGQLRSLVKLSPELVDDLRRLEIEAMRSARTGDGAALEARVRLWLEPFIGREGPFLAG